MDYVRSFEDITGDGLPDIPGKYKEPEGRIIIETSFNPVKLLAGGTAVTWGAFIIFIIITTVLIISGKFILKKIFRKGK